MRVPCFLNISTAAYSTVRIDLLTVDSDHASWSYHTIFLASAANNKDDQRLMLLGLRDSPFVRCPSVETPISRDAP